MQEINRLGATITPYRAIIFAAFAFALLALSSHGALDDFAHEQVANTTTESIGIYAAARLINASISVLQTSQVNVPLLASIQIGELLDPINDVVERLSSAMIWAIGSLFLQRIVLEITSSPVFKWTFFAFGLAVIFALLLFSWERSRNVFLRTLTIPEVKLDGCQDLIVRVFVIAAIFRFIVPVFIAISFLISQMILESEINENRESLSSFSAQVAMGSVDDRRLADQKSHKKSELEGLTRSLESLKRESEILDEKIDKLDDEAGWRGWLPETIGGGSPKDELASEEARREEIGHEMDQIQQRIQEGGEVLECIDRRLAGESCKSFWEKFTTAGKAGYARIEEIVDMAGDMATTTAKLLAAVVIRNIVIPLVFLMIAVKCSLPVIRYSMRLVSNTKRQTRELRNTPVQTDQGV